MVRLRWIVYAALFATAASRGSSAQEVPSVQLPSFAGTWAPSNPERSALLFKNGMSFVAGVSGKGRLVIEQRPDRLILTKQLPDDALDMMLKLLGRYDTTTVYRIVTPQGRSGGFGAAGDTRSSWQADRLVFYITDSAKGLAAAFSMDGEQLKVEEHTVVKGNKNTSSEWFTRVK